MDLSVVFPVYNEEGNLQQLYERTKEVLDNISYYFNLLGKPKLFRLYRSYELIFVDDGNKDNSLGVMKRLRSRDRSVKIIALRKNFGQTSALDAGFKNSQGFVVVSMDADLQNEPKDIPRLLAKMDEGYDVVAGWRRQRRDRIGKRLMSRIAHYLRRITLGDPIHDYGCTLRAYKSKCLNELELYGEMHRYIPPLLRWKGFRIAEIPVMHYKRHSGSTKYNLWRLFKGLMDLFNVWFWRKFSSRPVHIFGGLAVVIGLFGIVCAAWSIYLRVFRHSDLSDTFLPVVAIFSLLMSVHFFVSGILADIVIKNYFKGKEPYSVKEVIK